MKAFRLASALVLALAAGRAHAFHEGGVGACEGCHAMHSRPDGTQVGASLLQGSDESSTCLTCHAATTPIAAYQVMTSRLLGDGSPPLSYTPGGDFAWLKKTYVWTGAKGLEISPGDRHGHNVVAADYGLYPEGSATQTTAPGGIYPDSAMSCISCHDPHGRYRSDGSLFPSTSGSPIVASGSYAGTAPGVPGPGAAVGVYRLLGGTGYAPRAAGPSYAFSAPPPVAISPTNYNQSERVTEVRVAYGQGMSEWCQNCHTTIHPTQADLQAASTTAFKHPSGASAKLATKGESSIYSQYVRTGVLTGSQATSYTSLVPYEEGIADRATLSLHAASDGFYTAGPSPNGPEQVMCLSCHRAHASGWDHAMRWNMPANSTIVFGGSWPGVDAVGDAALPANAQGRYRADTRAAMYDRDPSIYSPYQKVLCNKCHAQD